MNIYDIGSLSIVSDDVGVAHSVQNVPAMTVSVDTHSINSIVVGVPGPAGPPGPPGSPGSGETNFYDATTTRKGIIQLSGDLAGTAGAPAVPALSDFENMVDLSLVFGNGLV